MEIHGEDFRYPIGEYQPQIYSVDLREEWLADIKFLPQAIEQAILNLHEAQLALQGGRMDDKPGCASRSGQPYQCLLPV
jgi:hypothetical protein